MNIKTIMKDHPIQTMLGSVLFGVVLALAGQTNTLEKRDYAQYRLVYKEAAHHGYEDYGKGCGDTEEGYAYFIETSDPQWYSSWEFTGKCSLSQDDATTTAQDLLKTKLKSDLSKEVVYNAYLEKEDVVTFSLDEE